MASKQDAAEAERPWLEAKKIIHGMQKKLSQMSKEDSSNKKLADLDAVEHMLETLRLACMATTFSDFKFAHDNRVLDKLWQVHSLISTEYKKALQRHRGHGQIVQFRTIEKQYAKHLKTAQYFYKGFVERLSARYHLTPLQRIARLMKSETIKLDEVIDAQEANLNQELTLACYRTLLHLGDLARYRMNTSRQKGHNPEMALTYYGLAQDLMPQEGDAHHQMAVVMADQHRDFGVVYHFFRSWAVRNPNNLAPQNLASEFKRLLQPPPARKAGNAAPDPYDMFGSWLIRLHAYYYKGEEFTQQDELEREVLHRWEVLLKSAEQPAYLQKALLTSIAAYDIALRRVKEEWSAAKSKSCQFILRFIVRTILVLSRVLEAETQRLFGGPSVEEKAPSDSAKTSGKDKNSGDKAGKKKSSASDTCLSLFRTCMAWILIQHEDLVKFQEHLNPHIVDMHRAATRCLSLFVEIISGTEAAPASYLLPEDAEVLGLAPLDSWTALHPSDSNDSFKVRIDEAGVQRLEPALETLARIYDIVESAIKLVSDDSFPWVATTVVESNQEVTRISYKEDHVTYAAPMAAVPIAAASMATPVPAPPLATVVAAPIVSKGQMNLPSQAAAELAKSPLAPPIETAPAASPSIPWLPWTGGYPIMAGPSSFPAAASMPQAAETDSELDLMDSEAFSRVENFLSPPESHQPRTTGNAARPELASLSPASYRRHTSMTDDVFGQLNTQRSPVAASTTAATTAVAAAARNPTSGPSKAKPFPSLPWEFVFQPTPYPPLQHAMGMDGHSRDGAALATKPVWGGAAAAVDEKMAFWSVSPSARSPGGLDNSSRGFPTALSPVGAAKATPVLGSSSSPWGPTDGRLLPQQLQQAQAETLGFGTSPGLSYSSHFTANPSSSMPSVQSPRGLRDPFISGFGRQNAPSTSLTGDGTFLDGQQNMRRRWQEAATAWGRGTPASRDDPTHFRNAVRQTSLMDETNAYDRNALLSALGSAHKSPQ